MTRPAPALRTRYAGPARWRFHCAGQCRPRRSARPRPLGGAPRPSGNDPALNSERRVLLCRHNHAARQIAMRRPAGIVTRSFSTAADRPSPHARAPIPVTVVATNQPTPAYRQHHDVAAPLVDATAFRQGWRVSSRLDALLEAGRIDREAWDAAHAWRRWAEVVPSFGRQSWDVRVGSSRGPGDGGMLLRVNAATMLREAAAALGGLRVRILEAVLVRDVPWAELGRLLRISDKTAQTRATEALEALANHCAGRPVAAPPVLRYRNEPGSL
jgi:hypothetical protein